MAISLAALVLLSICYVVAGHARPNSTQSPPGCLTLSPTVNAGRAVVELYAGDSLIAAEDLTVVSKLLAGRKRSKSEKEWRLCVGVEAESESEDSTEGIPVTLGGRESSLMEYGGSGPALASLAEEPAAAAVVAVHISSLEDSDSNATACMDPKGQCNFRSAVEFCAQFSAAEGDECVIVFPAAQTIYLDPSLGDVVIETGAGGITVEGNECTVAPLPGAASGMRMLRTQIKLMDAVSTFALTIRNMSVHSFGKDIAEDGADEEADGGVLWVQDVGSLVVESVVFADTRGASGGSLFTRSCGRVSITGCTFTNSSAVIDGGAVYITESSGVTIANCSFYYSSSQGSGGAIFFGQFCELVDVSSCVFADTSAALDGGGIVLFTGNKNLTISFCTFVDIWCGRNGGGVFVVSLNSGTIVTESVFTRIHAINGGGVGLLTGNVDTIISHSIFDDVSCEFGGGAVGAYSENVNLLVSDCEFVGTRAAIGAGVALHLFNEYIVITDCIFHNTSSSIVGGGVYFYSWNTPVSVTNCVFNNSFSDGSGGGIFADSTNYRLTVRGCLFHGCIAGELGGGIYMASNNDYSAIVRSHLVNCVALQGGAVVVGSGHLLVQIDFVEFTGNTAVTDGGAILVQDSNYGFEVDNCIFDGNVAEEYGGAIVIISSNSEAIISSSTFDFNTAGSGGGAIQSFFSNSDLAIDKCSFNENRAPFGGAVYFGEYHKGISVTGSAFFFNVADYGAALYVTQFNSGVSVVDSVMQQNTALEVGGALFALAEDVVVRGTVLSGNAAASGGAVHSHVETILFSECIVVDNSGHPGSHGGVYVENADLVEVRSTVFTNNSADSGGALSCLNCESFVLSNCSFRSNSAVGYGGGSLLVTGSSMRIDTSSFVGNIASTDGGAIRAEGMVNVTILDSTFKSNRAATGSGSAVWLSGCPNASLSDNRFDNNEALLGGGTVFWEVYSSMSEPDDVATANYFGTGNVALYGSGVATDAFDLNLSTTNTYYVSDYTSYISPIAVYVVDYYGEVVQSESAYQVVAQLLSPVKCHDDSPGFVTGGFVEQLSEGLATFSELLASCDPGYTMPVNLTCTLLDVTFATYFALNFRDCVTGEYFGDSACIECEAGTYSLTDPATTSLDDLGKQVCQPCPDGSASCFGNTIVLEEGYWRISDMATSTLRCPHRDSCRGGAGTGDALCRDGYEGPVCGACSDGYSYRESTQKCEPCSESAGLDAVVIVLICVILVVAVAVLYTYFCTDLMKKLRTMDDLYVFVFLRLGMLSADAASGWNEKGGAALKEESRVAGRVFKARLKIYVTLWQIVALLPFTLDLEFPNVYTAIASVLGVFNLNVSRSSLVTCSVGHRYDAIDALVVNTLYPIVLVGVLWAVFMIHSRLSESSSTPISVLKLRSRYFTLFLVFTYLILPFTSVQIFQVFSCRDVDPDDVEGGDDRYMAVDYSVSCSSTRYKFGFIWAIVSIFVYPVGVPAFYFYELYCSRHDIMRRNDNGGSEIEVEERDARLSPLRLLFEFYAPGLWYWEVIETVYRLLLTGVLVVIAHGSAVQIIVGVLVSLVFLKLCDAWNPYVDAKVQSLKEISQWQIFAVFFMALLLAADFDSVHTVVLDVLFVMAITANFVFDLVHVIWRKYVAVHLRYDDPGRKVWDPRRNRDPAHEVENPIVRNPAVGLVKSPTDTDIDGDGVRMSTLTSGR